MRFIGLTALVDAGIVFIAWLIVAIRHPRTSQDSSVSLAVRYFSLYLFFTLVFLVLLAIALLSFGGSVQAWVIITADIALWASLALFLLFVFAHRASGAKKTVLAAFLALAALGTLYQLAGVLGVTVALGPVFTYTLSQMAALLMYAVWIPSAVSFFLLAGRTTDAAVRARSVLFAIGLLFVTFSWATRLQFSPSLFFVGASSVMGFGLLLGGVMYRKAQPKANSGV